MENAPYRRMLHLVFLLLALPVMMDPAHAQNLTRIQFDLLDEEDGLSNHWLTYIAQDSSGFLWVATRDGLNRFDGYQFKVFRHDAGDSTSLQQDNGQFLYVDPKGRLWVGYQEGGISLFQEECQCFQNFYPSKGEETGLPVGPTRIYHIDEKENLWFGGYGMGLNVFNPETFEWARFDLPFISAAYSEQDQLAYNSVTYIYGAPNGLLWLCTANGLYSFDPETQVFSFKPYSPIDPKVSRWDYFNKIVPEGDKGFWLSAWAGGISYFDLETERFSTYRYNQQDFKTSIGNILYDIAPKNEDELWVATEDAGLAVFDRKKRTFLFLEEGPAAAQILITPEKVLFLLTNNGLLKYNPNAQIFHFRFLPIASSQNSDVFAINKIVEDPAAHAVYFATELGNGLNVMDTRTGRLQAFPVDIHPSSNDYFMIVADLLLDQTGRLWVLSRDYLYEYDKARKRLLTVRDPISREESRERPTFHRMVEAPDGQIWILTEQGDLFPFFPAERRCGAPINEGPVSGVAWDGHGRMWLAGQGELWVRDSATGQLQRPLAREMEALTENGIRGMTTDRYGNIWLGISRKGLLKIETQDPAHPAPARITAPELLPTNRIFNLGSDPEGNIWMSTIMGVVYLNADDLTYRIFNQAVGMEKNTLYMRFFGGRDGTFYITTPGRYCKVDLEAVKREAPRPRVYIDKLTVANRDISRLEEEGAPVRVQPGEDFFSFDFGCIDFTNQALNKFAYMLEGWDEDWVQSGSRRYASYTNLDGGQYVFKVRVANNEGVWGEPVSVPLFIETPFYRKSWFILLVTLIFAGLIYALYLYRVRQIEQTEQLKTEFNRQLAETRLEALRAQMNPHFIFNCLNSINRYIIKSDIKTSSLYLTRFAKLIRLILDNSEHKIVVLSNEMEALRLYVEMEALRFDHKFTFDICIAPDVDADNIEVPPLIIQPYVENAIWHGLLHKESGGHLSVSLSRENGSLICEITDNGIGREKAMEFKSRNAPTRQSIGMKLTEERLHIASGDFSRTGSQKIIDLFDENGEASGTKVILTIPV